jgi:hypothetical protein
MDEYDIQELKAQDRFERQMLARLMANPDCRDPDHPGCEKCEDEDE